MKQRKKNKAGLLLGILFAALILFSGCEKTPVGQGLAKAPKKVEVWQAEPEVYEESMVASAPASAFREHRISAEVPGMLQLKHAERGDWVKGGDVLFQIDPTGFDLRVKEQSAKFARAEARYRFMQSELKRKEPLFRDKTLSKAGWEQAQFDAASALAERDQARVALEQAKRDLRRTTLLSPFDGMILESNHDPGEVVPVGSVFALIADATQVTFDVGVSDLDLPGLSLGQHVAVLVDALPGQHFEGMITRISGNASPAQGTFPVEVKVDNKAGEIMPGMVGRVKLVGKAHKDQIIIPMMAVHQHLGEPYVFLVEGEKVYFKPIKLGKVLGDRALVLKGVVAGDQVVLVSQGRLEDGEKVEVIR